MVLMLVSAAIYAQCLAVFSTLVAEQFGKLRLSNMRALSVKYYCRWRALPEEATKMLAKFVRERTPERNPDLQLLLPANPRPQNFAEYERKLFNALNPLVRTDLREKLFAHHIEEAQAFSWLAPFKRAVRETVAVLTFEVFTPGALLFEANEKVRHIILVTAGQVSIEYEEDDEEFGNNDRKFHSVLDLKAKAATAAIVHEAIQELLPAVDAQASSSDDDEESAETDIELSETNLELEEPLGILTEVESVTSTDNASSGRPDNASMQSFDKTIFRPAAEEKIDNSWQFATKVLEKFDQGMHFDFSKDEDHVLDRKMMPVEEAPCVFGENSMWFAEITNGFSGRSVNYSELLRIPTSTLLQIVKSDPRLRMRHYAFRQAVKQFEEAVKSQ
jgi:hypothetical protein